MTRTSAEWEVAADKLLDVVDERSINLGETSKIGIVSADRKRELESILMRGIAQAQVCATLAVAAATREAAAPPSTP